MHRKSSFFVSTAVFGLLIQVAVADAATVVALGASNTAGAGVSPSQAYPAQLEAMLHVRGLDVSIINAGISGDTTEHMMSRLGTAVPRNTKIVILQPGGNDMRRGARTYTSEIRKQLRAMGIRVVMVPNSMFRGKPHQADGIHLTAEGYHMLAQQLVRPVVNALR
ncbi:MAG: acyl-CoA thioesterase [Bradyrhizobium sp.]|nr:acyl-CoA thioesterase [Pseudomonadota bacterium]MDE2468168.1 acyl-CoA thioesterase [Bradyrhizobium sp.]